MPEITDARKSYEVSTAIIHRQDGSCRRILKQRSDTVGGRQVLTVMMDKFFLPGTFVNQDTGEIIHGPGECQRWTQAYTFMELVSITANAIAKGLDLRRVLAGPVAVQPETQP